MKKYRTRPEVDLGEREAVSTIRARYAQALERGMSIEAATAYANGRGEEAASTQVVPPTTITSTKIPDTAYLATAERREQQRAVVIPDDWQSLPYVPRTAGAPNLKALASQVSDTPISNKNEAIAAIEAEIALRAAESDDQGNAPDPVAIPDDWQGLPLPERIALAVNFTDDSVQTEADVERVIQTELARRAVQSNG